MKKKLTLILVAISLCLALFSGCGDASAEKENNNSDSSASSEEKVIENSKDDKEDKSNATAKNFESIGYFSDIFEDAASYIDEGASSLDDMSVLGEMLTLNTLQMITLNASLDQALQGMKDEWNTGKLDMLSGTGQYESTLSKNGKVYEYTYNTYYDDRNDKSVLKYDTERKTIDFLRTSDSDISDNVLVQEYIDENGALYISYARHLNSTQEMTQMVIYYDGQNACYGYSSQISSDKPVLPVDIIASKPDSWDSLLNGIDYNSVLTYDGKTPEYECKQ